MYCVKNKMNKLNGKKGDFMLISKKVEKVHFGTIVTPEVRNGIKKLAHKHEINLVDYLTAVYEDLISGKLKLDRK